MEIAIIIIFIIFFLLIDLSEGLIVTTALIKAIAIILGIIAIFLIPYLINYYCLGGWKRELKKEREKTKKEYSLEDGKLTEVLFISAQESNFIKQIKNKLQEDVKYFASMEGEKFIITPIIGEKKLETIEIIDTKVFKENFSPIPKEELSEIELLKKEYSLKEELTEVLYIAVDRNFTERVYNILQKERELKWFALVQGEKITVMPVSNGERLETMEMEISDFKKMFKPMPT